MVIDFHTHTFPDAIAEKAVAKLAALSRTHPFTNGTEGALKASMAKAGVDASVVLPVATNPEKVGKMNDLSIAKNGEGGLIYFGCIHPLMENAGEELRRLASSGIRGIKLHPVYQGVDADGPEMLRILDRAGEEGLAVVLHAGDDIGFPGAAQASPEKIARALAVVGEVKLIAAHMGGWKKWEEALELLAPTSACLDTSFSLGRIPAEGDAYSEEEARLLSEEAFCKTVRAFGAERIFFGTDSPWTGQAESLGAIRDLPLAEEEKALILGENARKLLRL